MKNIMRQECTKRRVLLSDKLNKDDAIFRRLIASDLYKKSQRIMTYVSMSNEVDTHRLIRHALQEDKQVYLPKVISKTEMILCEISSFEDLTPGKLNILEPRTNDAIDPKMAQLIIVPALGFTTSGHRLGYGGGYYDRLLAHINCDTMGLCYEDCLFESLPIEQHDMPVDTILTEERELMIWGMTA